MRIILSCLIVVFTVGCASAAKHESMTSTNQSAISFNGKFVKSISVEKVVGGKKTSLVHGGSQVESQKFESAIEASLSSYGLLSQEADKKYYLKVDLLSQSMASWGTGVTTVNANYTLIEISTNKELLNKRIESHYKSRFSDSMIALKRGRIAKEKAAKLNIENFLQVLYELSKI